MRAPQGGGAIMVEGEGDLQRLEMTIINSTIANCVADAGPSFLAVRARHAAAHCLLGHLVLAMEVHASACTYIC